MQNSLEDNSINSGAILNRDLMGGNDSKNSRKNSHMTTNRTPHVHQTINPIGRGIQGSGATLNDPYSKRQGKNMVTVKPGLELISQNLVGNTQTAFEPGPGIAGDTPDNERESQAHTPPRGENTLTPINSKSAKKNYGTKLPQI